MIVASSVGWRHELHQEFLLCSLHTYTLHHLYIYLLLLRVTPLSFLFSLLSFLSQYLRSTAVRSCAVTLRQLSKSSSSTTATGDSSSHSRDGGKIHRTRPYYIFLPMNLRHIYFPHHRRRTYHIMVLSVVVFLYN
jgi:hypothetical protein